MATRAKQKSDFTSLYRGQPGQYSWLFMRISGVAIILFLFAHVIDTAVVGWGPEAYNRVVSVYHNWVVRILELGLVTAVVYHALNGVKIMVFDFYPKSVRWFREISAATSIAFVAAMIPIVIIMGRQILDLAFGWKL